MEIVLNSNFSEISYNEMELIEGEVGENLDMQWEELY